MSTLRIEYDDNIISAIEKVNELLRPYHLRFDVVDEDFDGYQEWRLMELEELTAQANTMDRPTDELLQDAANKYLVNAVEYASADFSARITDELKDAEEPPSAVWFPGNGTYVRQSDGSYKKGG